MTDAILACVRLAGMPEAVFPDDDLRTCDDCGETVRVRPYMPKVTPICTRCLPAFLERYGAPQ